MQHSRLTRRLALLALGLGAALAPASREAAARSPGTGAYGAFLSGRFAASEIDLGAASDRLLRALAFDPSNPDLLQQAFIAAVMDGRPEAVPLAKRLPGNEAAQLLLANEDARHGRWDAAEQRYAALPRQGITQVLQPLLLAWAQQGGGRTEAALSTLRPFTEGERFRGVYALHAAMIADLAGRNADAGRLYRAAQTDYGVINLRLAQIIASWQARHNHSIEAQATLQALAENAPDLGMALPGLTAAVTQRAVSRATEGLAEAFLALAASLRQQDTSPFALLMLSYALDLRPDLTAARLLLADMQGQEKHVEAALATLSPVSPADPLAPLVRLRRAVLVEQLGDTEQALQELDRLAQDFPERPEPLQQEGDILRQDGRFKEAVQLYSEAIGRVREPGGADWVLFYDRAVAYDRAHEWPQAEADLERALQLSPEQPYVLNYLGYSWAEQDHNLPRARQMIEKALDLQPNEASIIDSLGWVLLREGDDAGAVSALERAAELQPEDATINGHLGDAYYALGRGREAEFQWRRALNLHPDPGEAARLRTKLHDAETAHDVVPATAERHDP